MNSLIFLGCSRTYLWYKQTHLISSSFCYRCAFVVLFQLSVEFLEVYLFIDVPESIPGVWGDEVKVGHEHLHGFSRTIVLP